MPDSENLCPLRTVRSRKVIEDVDKSWVYLMLGWSEFSKSKKSKKVGSVSGHMTKMSSMYLIQSMGMGVPFCNTDRNSCSWLAMNRFAKVGTHFVPTATPVSLCTLSR